MVEKRSELVVVEKELLKVEAELVERSLNERGVYEAIADIASTDKSGDGVAESEYLKFVERTGLDWFCPLRCDYVDLNPSNSPGSTLQRFWFSFVLGTIVGVADGLFYVQNGVATVHRVQPVDEMRRGVTVRLCANVLDGTDMEVKVRPSLRDSYISSSVFMMETKKPSVAAGAAAGAFVAGAPGALVGAAIQRDRRREAIAKERETFSNAPKIKVPNQARYLDFQFATASVFVDEHSPKAYDEYIFIEQDEDGEPFSEVSEIAFRVYASSTSGAAVYAPEPNHELLLRAKAGKEFYQQHAVGLGPGNDMFSDPDHFSELVAENYSLTDVASSVITKARDPRWMRARQVQLVLIRYGRDHGMKDWYKLFDIMPSEALSNCLLNPEVTDEAIISILNRCRELIKKAAQIRNIAEERDEEIRNLSHFGRLTGKDQKINSEYNERIKKQNKALDEDTKGFIQLGQVMPRDYMSIV
ncbi:hypothetical protein [Candidatus Collinsella stercoripullorum]|uniref:hypothetical protein n=1 Tax=Candidatus Collinsella stercoripullorum TaxID=2838522 RepID=UPI0022E8D02F|nr:hypothetical protein [Candidatus Collinsella stercoripullorum]